MTIINVRETDLLVPSNMPPRSKRSVAVLAAVQWQPSLCRTGSDGRAPDPGHRVFCDGILAPLQFVSRKDCRMREFVCASQHNPAPKPVSLLSLWFASPPCSLAMREGKSRVAILLFLGKLRQNNYAAYGNDVGHRHRLKTSPLSSLIDVPGNDVCPPSRRS